jgi:cellulose synthase/poly-beta-1,6-N-acetylglucosamine synthase-like glycosyltransferase
LKRAISVGGAEHRRELLVTWAGIAVTWVAVGLFSREIITSLVHSLAHGTRGDVVEHLVFLGIIYSLAFGSLVYMAARIGWVRREAPPPPNEVDAFLDETADTPSLLILVPSYKEDPHVVRQTLMSAALQDYGPRRVVLLIDDPPNPLSSADRKALGAVRHLPGEVATALAGPARRLAEAAQVYQRGRETCDPAAEFARLAALHDLVAEWFEREAEREVVRNHMDAFYVENILIMRARQHKDRAVALRMRTNEGPETSPLHIDAEYRRLGRLFDASFGSFERKRYVNLSHEPNKAMNINSYLGLVGGAYREVRREDGLHLISASPEEATLTIPDAVYVINLDADSQLLHDYAARLVHFMGRPENTRIGVVQTPYHTYPGAPGVLERAAGATTDIQYLIHQGFTRFRATFWVGANALLRRTALEDIRVHDEERGFEIVRFIEDRTVIEDTESTIDLVASGWRLHNYPQSLSFSATPPDFGSLLIQRRRWANGGLIILPKLLRYLLRLPWRPQTLAEGAMRFYYLASLTLANIGMLAILLYPFDAAPRSLWAPLAAVPYFYLYGRDLVRLGYRWTDLPRVYALNMMLIPVNLGGIAKSIHQGLTRQKIPFGRTPKVEGRTSAPALYILFEFGLLICMVWGFVGHIGAQRVVYAGFTLLHAGFFAYVLVYYMGVRACYADLRRQLAPSGVRLTEALASMPATTPAPVRVSTPPSPVRAHRPKPIQWTFGTPQPPQVVRRP